MISGTSFYDVYLAAFSRLNALFELPQGWIESPKFIVVEMLAELVLNEFCTEKYYKLSNAIEVNSVWNPPRGLLSSPSIAR